MICDKWLHIYGNKLGTGIKCEWVDDVRENVKGEWGRTKNGFIYCSNCEETWYDNAWTDNWHYCPNCGADMRGEA